MLVRATRFTPCAFATADGLISKGADPIDPHRRAAAGLDSCPLGISLIRSASADEVFVATAQWIMA